MVKDEVSPQDVMKEVYELIDKAVAKLNNLDSRKDKADCVQTSLNSLIAGVELSKLEKAGILIYLERKRVQ